MNLSKHISELLKYNECVIVPEFGGFISNYQPSRFDATRNTFLPPSKEVIFNSKIRKNDGLLISRLVEAEQIGYHQAEMAVLNFVDGLNRELNEGKKIELEFIGSFEFDRSGSIIFKPFHPFELLQAYGLKEVQYPTLKASQIIGNYQPRPAVRVLNNRKEVIKIAASIALVLTLSLFPVKTDKLNLSPSALNPVEFLMNENSLPVTIVTSEKPIENKTEVSIETKNPLPFILVGGCFQFEKNAEQYQTELKNSGYHPEILKLENGNYRVIVDSYPSKEKALDAMTTFRTHHQGSGVWVSTR